MVNCVPAVRYPGIPSVDERLDVVVVTDGRHDPPQCPPLHDHLLRSYRFGHRPEQRSHELRRRVRIVLNRRAAALWEGRGTT